MQYPAGSVHSPKSSLKREITAALVLKVALLGALWAIAVHGVQGDRHADVADLFGSPSAAASAANQNSSHTPEAPHDLR